MTTGAWDDHRKALVASGRRGGELCPLHRARHVCLLVFCAVLDVARVARSASAAVAATAASAHTVAVAGAGAAMMAAAAGTAAATAAAAPS